MLPSQVSRELQQVWKSTMESKNPLHKIPVIGEAYVLAPNPTVLHHSHKRDQTCNVTNSKHLDQIQAKIDEAAKNWRSLGIVPPWEKE